MNRLAEWERPDPCHTCKLDRVAWRAAKGGRYLVHDDGRPSCRFPCKVCEHRDCDDARGGNNNGNDDGEVFMKAKTKQTQSTTKPLPGLAAKPTNATKAKATTKPARAHKRTKSASKLCGRCERTRMAKSFHSNAARPSGLADWCRECLVGWRVAHAKKAVAK